MDITHFGLDDVVFLHGAMDQNKVLETLLTADAFVLPCATEKNGAMDGIPVALMEAMALKLPVISTNISGVPELIRQGAGILVDSENPMQLAKNHLLVIHTTKWYYFE